MERDASGIFLPALLCGVGVIVGGMLVWVPMAVPVQAGRRAAVNCD